MNKQPFYHYCSLIFTATEELDSDEVLDVIKKSLCRKFGEVILKDSIEYDEPLDVDAGDPYDLM